MLSGYIANAVAVLSSSAFDNYICKLIEHPFKNLSILININPPSTGSGWTAHVLSN